ncbi:MAG: threonine/serine exporter family protein [Gemmatimonadetes bacterium]|nr:threonine/serine exporter family protein [Gemmatimonadota bacterium]
MSLPFPTPRPSGSITATHEIAIVPRLLIELATQLHTHGFAAHRIEGMLVAAAEQLRVEAQFFTTPTSLFVAFGEDESQRVHLVRVEPGETNLGMMAALDEIATAVASGAMPADRALARLAALPAEAPRYPAWMTVVAFSLVAVAVASLLDVGVLDLGVAAVAGLVTGMLAIGSGRWTALVPILEPASAFFVSVVCLSAATLTGSTHAYATTAFLALPGAFPLVNPSLPDWVAYLSPVIAAGCFVVLLRADRRDAPLIILAGIVAWASARLGARLLDDQLGGFVGAFAVSAGSNAAARFTRRSAMVTTIPGLLLLVPGSIGFQSINSLLGQDATAGVEAAFRVVLVGISLAAGLLLGTALVPPPRATQVAPR